MALPTRARRDPLADLDPADVVARWSDHGLDELSDADLVEVAARHLALPRLAPADSFVLHAPLELMARAALLRHVEPTARERARQRIAWLVTSYDVDHDPDPAGVDRAADRSVSGVVSLRNRLADAVAAGDLDEVDRLALAVASTTSAGDLVACLADLVVDRLAAAGHGSIFLYHLPRLLAADPAAGGMARGLLREIARHPEWRLTWMDAHDPGLAPSDDLGARLLGTPTAGDPGSHFIYPTMSLVEREGLAGDLLARPTMHVPVPDARRELLRVAAWSMLQDDPDHAPYGWSHALTMPQATLGVAPAGSDAGRSVAVAATFVLGFRATLGAVTLDPSWQPDERPDLDEATFLDDGADAAAAAVWHAGDEDHRRYVRRLATVAALHPDAHLAKYTLACLDATRDDPEAGRLYTAAAAYLAGWWRHAGGDDDLFAGGG